MSRSDTKLSVLTRAEMGVMAGVVATVAMSIAIIAVTAISSAWNGFFSIQWFTWLGAAFGAAGTPVQLAELGILYFVLLSVIAGLVFAFVYSKYTVYQGLAFGAIAWFILVVYMTLYTAPQVSGTLANIPFNQSLELLIPLAICFAIWGAVMGYVGKNY
jgi:magnesium-transporting ATPase (P-type)